MLADEIKLASDEVQKEEDERLQDITDRCIDLFKTMLNDNSFKNELKETIVNDKIALLKRSYNYFKVEIVYNSLKETYIARIWDYEYNLPMVNNTTKKDIFNNLVYLARDTLLKLGFNIAESYSQHNDCECNLKINW